MTHEPLDRGDLVPKSAPPVPHPLAFRRAHVRSYLESSSGAPILLLRAPAGFGKTTALSFLAAQEGPSARWVRLDERDRSLESFVASIVSAIYGWPVAAPSVAEDVREAARWVAGALAEQGVTTLVLDDYEVAAASEATGALVEAVVERLPPYGRVAVACETPPAFLTRARLRQAIVEVDAGDLRFDAEDVARYVREVHRYDLPDAAASSLARRSGGCAAVVNLVGQLSHNLPRYLRLDVEALPLGTGEEHMTLLLREVLARGGHPPARAARELLRARAGTPGGTSPADALLDFLRERHCLVHAYAAPSPATVPHELLRRLAARL